MITSREQLVRCANEWLNVARTDLQRKMSEFIRSVGASQDEIAEMLAISDYEMQNILNGNANISLDTFAKLLIATGNAIEIKPVEKTPLNGKKRKAQPQSRQIMPIPGMMPLPPFMRGGRMMPPPNFDGMTEFPMPEPSQLRGEAMQRPTMPHRKIQVSRKELIDAVMKNGLDGEIDLMNSTSDEIAHFCRANGIEFGRDVTQRPRPEQCACEEVPQRASEKPNEFDEIAKMMAEELRNRPDLLSQIKRYIS